MNDTPNSYISPQVHRLTAGSVGASLETDKRAGERSGEEAGEEISKETTGKADADSTLSNRASSANANAKETAGAEGKEEERGRRDAAEEETDESFAAPTIEQLLQSTKNLWRGGYQEGYAEQDCLGTGFASLDDLLPGSGWPRQGLIEVVNRRPGIGELQLFLPLMRTLIAQGLWVLWIAPPFSPYAPGLAQAGIDLRRVLVVALPQKQFDGKRNPDVPVLISEGSMTSKDALWCMERALQTPHCGLVLAWQGQLPQRTLRRLQLAAVTGKAVGVLFMKQYSEHSPSSISLEIKGMAAEQQEYLDIDIRKARGSFKPSSLRLRLNDLPGAPASTSAREDRQTSRTRIRRSAHETELAKSQKNARGEDQTKAQGKIPVEAQVEAQERNLSAVAPAKAAAGHSSANLEIISERS